MAHTAERWTPLHLASANGHLNMTKLLVERGADVGNNNDKAETPWDRAAKYEYLDIARFLVASGATISYPIPQDIEIRAHLHIAKFLLECGVDVDIRNGSDETSLYLASGSGKLDIVCFLVEHGADVNIQHDNLWSPLHIAAANGHLEIAELLVEHETSVDVRTM